MPHFTPLGHPDLPAGWSLRPRIPTAHLEEKWHQHRANGCRLPEPRAGERRSSRRLGPRQGPRCNSPTSPENLPSREVPACEKGFNNRGGGAGGRWRPALHHLNHDKPPLAPGGVGTTLGTSCVLRGHSLFTGVQESVDQAAAFLREKQIF